MYYKALGTSSKLFLSKCGHLAIRVDEWPSEAFAWPVHLPEGSMPDVWLPDASFLKGAKLQKCDQPARPPPHADLGASMAWKVETPSAPIPGGSLHGVNDGAVLRSIGHASGVEGQIAAPSLSTTDCNNYAYVNHGSPDAECAPDRSLSKPAGQLSSPERPAPLWRPAAIEWLSAINVEQGGWWSKQETMVSVRAKASPTATTPMDLPPTLKNRAKASTKAKSTASSDGSLLRLEHLQLRQNSLATDYGTSSRAISQGNAHSFNAAHLQSGLGLASAARDSQRDELGPGVPGVSGACGVASWPTISITGSPQLGRRGLWRGRLGGSEGAGQRRGHPSTGGGTAHVSPIATLRGSAGSTTYQGRCWMLHAEERHTEASPGYYKVNPALVD